MTETTSEYSAIGGVDRRDILGTMEMFQVMIMPEVTCIHTFVPTCRIVALKYVHFVVHEIDFNKVGWKRSELDCASTPLYNLTCFLSNSILCISLFWPHQLKFPKTCQEHSCLKAFPLAITSATDVLCLSPFFL